MTEQSDSVSHDVSVEGSSEEVTPEEFRKLVNQNGLCQLFANRARAQILTTLFYIDGFLTPKEISNYVGISQSATLNAVEQLEQFDMFRVQERDGVQSAYQLEEADELVEQIRSLGVVATERSDVPE